MGTIRIFSQSFFRLKYKEDHLHALEVIRTGNKRVQTQAVVKGKLSLPVSDELADTMNQSDSIRTLLLFASWKPGEGIDLPTDYADLIIWIRGRWGNPFKDAALAAAKKMFPHAEELANEKGYLILRQDHGMEN